ELRSATVTAPGGGATILHPTSLTLRERRISIIGGNGSGKSTLARLLNGLIEPSAGRVTVTAEETSAGTPREAKALDTVRDGSAVRRQVGFVFTDPAAQLIMPT